MISLSRVIKSGWTPPLTEEKKIISIKVMERNQNENQEEISFQSDADYQQLMEQARLEAQAILAKAQQQADEIIYQVNSDKQSWEQEKQSLSEEARQLGYNEGYEQGRMEGFNEYQEHLNLAKSVIDSSKQDYFIKVESSENVILDIGLKVAGKILGKTLENQPEEFLSIVRRALKEARDYREIQIHVHPVQYDLLLSQKDELVRIFPKETDLYIYPDDDLSELTCIIESSNGRIDASVDGQLVEIKEKLFELLESENS
ncbi:flagellar assembly protein FliH [Bacillus massilinigeriensis]|uniref:flagellar assembly protein FliH n=1 Tax=Bacillus massilionigeriensis TaxID=1805475 RepID=UPI000BE7DD4F|nr:flagellar assembly protein FliH [Bacillus massilionigeriensis]